MKNLVTVLIIVTVLALAVLVIDAAFPTPGERAARDARAQARAQAAQAWASQADERASAVSVALWGMVAVTLATVAGVGAAVVRLAVVRSGTLHANREHALYPAILHRGQWLTVNEQSAQQFAALPARPTAAVTRALIGTPRATGEPRAPQVIDATPVVSLPTRCSVYDCASPSAPALLLGQTVNGPLSLPLHNLGNVLVGGLPGSGKSELLAAMIAGLLRAKTAQLAVIDPKMVDFGTIPHDLAALFAPVATEHGAAVDLVGELLTECQRRFAMLKDAGARSLAAYNALPDVQRLPYIAAFVDELADFAGDKQFVGLALEIGRKGRAAGVSLILATQRPSADVVDSSLRAVAGASVAFRVRNGHDSRTIIGDGGAELLPPDVPGRCIVQRGDLVHCQAYYAGLASGHFDRFLSTMPKRLAGTSSGTPEPVLDPVRTGIPVEVAGFEPASRYVPIDVPMPTAPDEAITEAQRRAILDAYRRAGSLKGAQRLLYPDLELGGWRWYQIRSIVQEMQP